MVETAQEKFKKLIIEDRELDKWEIRAKEAIESDPRIKVNGINIRRPNALDLKTIGWPTRMRQSFWIIFSFECPCGDIPTEVFQLDGLWKSKFDTHLSWLKEFTYQHLVKEGFI